MAVNIYYTNPIDIAFYNWVRKRESHPSDMQRFYVFVNTVCNYYKTEGKKWHKGSKFHKECENNNLSIEDTKKYFNLLDTIIQYRIIYKNSGALTKRKRGHRLDNKEENEYVQIGLFNGKFKKLKISKQEFEKNGVSKTFFLKHAKTIE